jgi:hypothetical protein
MVDMGSDAIDERLRRLAEESRHAPRGPRIDMSAQAVTLRLETLSGLSRLCSSLAEAGRSHRSPGRGGSAR